MPLKQIKPQNQDQKRVTASIELEALKQLAPDKTEVVEIADEQD